MRALHSRLRLPLVAAGALLLGGPAHAQFGGGQADMPVALLTLPWAVLVVAAVAARFLAPAWRAGFWRAARRALAVYAFFEIVPLFAAIVLKAAFDIGGQGGMTVYLLAMMGVLFSGPVLCVLITVAIVIEAAWRWARRPA